MERESENMLKIGIITNMPTPYRRKQWKSYSNINNLELTVFYCTKREKGRYWDFRQSYSFKEKFLRGFSIGQFHFNPSIFKIMLENFNFFVIGGYSYPTLIIALIFLQFIKKPYIMMIDGISTHVLTEKNALSFIRKFMIRGASAYLANGKVGKKLLVNYEIPEEKIFNQYMTVDIDYFFKLEKKGIEKRNLIRKKYGISDKTLVVLYVGRLIPGKGIETLIKAVEKLKYQNKDLKALIVGEGPLKTKLKKQAMNSNSIIFTGHVKYFELYKYYYASDILVFPTYDDVWGLVVNEAMACSLPVIVSSAAGCSLDLVENNGFIMEPGNVNDLSDKIKKLMDPKLRKLYGKRSQKLILDWNYYNSTKSFLGVINHFYDTGRI